MEKGWKLKCRERSEMQTDADRVTVLQLGERFMVSSFSV